GAAAPGQRRGRRTGRRPPPCRACRRDGCGRAPTRLRPRLLGMAASERGGGSRVVSAGHRKLNRPRGTQHGTAARSGRHRDLAYRGLRPPSGRRRRPQDLRHRAADRRRGEVLRRRGGHRRHLLAHRQGGVQLLHPGPFRPGFVLRRTRRPRRSARRLQPSARARGEAVAPAQARPAGRQAGEPDQAGPPL
ncbi:MAG: hypothetical protein AVDCRST_MAG04-3930, partial [uncultured Acetobacteraceae bacterium]